jgi:triosephosphate isomerase
MYIDFMNLPVIIVNFKLYKQASGESALVLAKIHERVARETGASIGIAVSPLDIISVAPKVDIPVFSQHIDPVGYGSHTGHISPYMVREMGAYGTLLNHAEHQLGEDVLRKSIEMAHDADLFTVVCANSPEEALRVAECNPGLIAVEPPELIGGDISVAKADPGIVERSVELVGKGRVLVGAGIKTGEDVRISLALGASGVLLASGVTRAEDPFSVLMDLVSGLK